MTVSVRLKIAVLAPTPRARERMANGGGGRRAGEYAKGVADVLNDGLEEIDAASFAALFFEMFVAAECKTRAATGFTGSEARLDVLLDLLLEMKTQLVIHFRFESLAAK
jgi:hypothetical protein